MAQARKKKILKAKGKKPSRGYGVKSKFVSANGVKKLKPAVAGNMTMSGSVGVHNV